MEIKTEKFTGGGGGYELLKFKDCDIFYLDPLCPGPSRVHYKIVIRKEKKMLQAFPIAFSINLSCVP